jgi:glyoxylase-like metal-dependent hydrolase (beta-lactamase superfamily II)
LPLALRLKRELGVRLAGHPSLPLVDIGLADGESLAIGGEQIQAVATPGHTRDHLCYLLPRQQVVFSGDHVVGAGTVVIGGPDGDLVAYLASLRRLLELAPRLLLPGHGPVVEDPRQRVQDYIDHRARREQQVLDNLAERPRTLAELVKIVYPDVSAEVLPFATRTLGAQLDKLRAEGRVRQTGLLWNRM